VYSIADIAADAQYLARDMILPVQVDGLGEVLMPGIVPKLASAPGAVRWPGPALGLHTESVLTQDLGLGPEEIERLRASGAVAGGAGKEESMSAGGADTERRLARDVPPDRLEDPEVRRWLETAARALDTVLAHVEPVDGPEPTGGAEWS